VKRIMQWAGRNATMIALAVLGVWLLRALAYAAFWVVFFGLALAFAVGLFP
jgi:threonine/homoserine efflux transporter RhtA